MENGVFAMLVARTIYLLTKTDIPPDQWTEAIHGVHCIQDVPCEFNMVPFFNELLEHRALYGQLEAVDIS